MKKRKRCDKAPNCGCHATKQPPAELISKHEEEHTRRLKWCIDNNHLPAHSFVHLAPGDDSNFVYGVAPWFEDGSVNPQGVYTGPVDEKERQWVALEKQAQHQTWRCKSCKCIVPGAPRAWIPKNGVEEPWDWWFCVKCKATQSKPSKKDLKRQKEIKQNHKIPASWTQIKH